MPQGMHMVRLGDDEREKYQAEVQSLKAEVAALKSDIACRPGELDLLYRVREALGFNNLHSLSHLDDDVRKLKRVEQEARRLIKDGVRLTPNGLVVKESPDKSDPHYALCKALDLIEVLNPNPYPWKAA